jgi:hypothetical protein
LLSPFHGENTGSIPVGRANYFNSLGEIAHQLDKSMSDDWPISRCKPRRTQTDLCDELGRGLGHLCYASIDDAQEVAREKDNLNCLVWAINWNVVRVRILV